FDALAATFGERARQFHCLLDQRRDVERNPPHRQLTRLDPHALEQIVDQAAQPHATGLESEYQLERPPVGVREAIPQQLERGVLRRERRLQLMRQLRDGYIPCPAGRLDRCRFAPEQVL